MVQSSKVYRSDLCKESLLWQHIAPSDFIDCFETTAYIAPRRAAEIITDFPGWTRPLLKLRELVTAPFGLSQEGPQAADKLGPFPVEIETEDELVAGFNDKHLNFRVSVIARAGKVSLATWVHPHNIGGRLYLASILPIHILIARNALHRVAAQAAAGPAT